MSRINYSVFRLIQQIPDPIGHENLALFINNNGLSPDLLHELQSLFRAEDERNLGERIDDRAPGRRSGSRI